MGDEAVPDEPGRTDACGPLPAGPLPAGPTDAGPIPAGPIAAPPEDPRASFAIAAGFVVATVAALCLAVVYALGGQPQLEGMLLALALGGIGFGIAGWGKHLMPNGPFVQEREPLVSTYREREEFVESFERGSDTITRRRLLRRLMGGAVTALGAALLFPIRSLGPDPGSTLDHTAWAPGARLVDADGKPVQVTDVSVGGVVTVFPEGHEGDATAQTVLIRVSDSPVVTRAGRETWSPQGYVAFSKVCTHAGCPVGLYQQRTNQLLCPCHQSLFDVAAGAKPVFGPAPRSLPQLPIAVDAAGFLVAQSDFREPIGPAFWNRR